MAVYPGAKWEPITGGTDGPVSSWLGAVLHVNDSNGADLYQWENNGANGMSSHFQVAKTGTVYQYLDTTVDSWCQMSGNQTYISIETEGYPTEALTDAQVAAIAALYKWLHDTHNIPYTLAETPGQVGFGWHGMGGAAWGGHTGCPGDLRRTQRQHILDIAAPQPQPTPIPLEDDAMFLVYSTHPGQAHYLVFGGVIVAADSATETGAVTAGAQKLTFGDGAYAAVAANAVK